MYSDRLIEHFRNPRNAGLLDFPAVSVEITNAACGDILRLSAIVKDGIIQRAAFQARGCTPSIACGSALTVWLTGRGTSALSALTDSEIASAIEAEVDGVPPASKHAAHLAASAVRQLLARLNITSG